MIYLMIDNYSAQQDTPDSDWLISIHINDPHTFKIQGFSMNSIKVLIAVFSKINPKVPGVASLLEELNDRRLELQPDYDIEGLVKRKAQLEAEIHDYADTVERKKQELNFCINLQRLFEISKGSGDTSYLLHEYDGSDSQKKLGAFCGWLSVRGNKLYSIVPDTTDSYRSCIDLKTLTTEEGEKYDSVYNWAITTIVRRWK